MDRLFKLGLLLLFAVCLFLYWRQSQNGRYAMVPDKQIVLDTRTGIVYVEHASFFGCESEPPGCVDRSAEVATKP